MIIRKLVPALLVMLPLTTFSTASAQAADSSESHSRPLMITAGGVAGAALFASMLGASHGSTTADNSTLAPTGTSGLTAGTFTPGATGSTGITVVEPGTTGSTGVTVPTGDQGQTQTQTQTNDAAPILNAPAADTVPEPTTAMLVVTGLIGLAPIVRRRSR